MFQRNSWSLLVKFVSSLNEIKILDGTGLSFPSILLPSMHPLVERLYTQVAVRKNDVFGIPVIEPDEFKATYDGHHLHAIVRGVRDSTVVLGHNFIVVHNNDAPTSRSRIWTASTVRKNPGCGTLGVLFQDLG